MSSPTPIPAGAPSLSPNGVLPNAPARTALLTADELAARWQVPKAQVYRLSRDGAIPTVRIGRYYRYALAAVNEFERTGGVSADA